MRLSRRLRRHEVLGDDRAVRENTLACKKSIKSHDELSKLSQLYHMVRDVPILRSCLAYR